jgi:hypothetical protein
MEFLMSNNDHVDFHLLFVQYGFVLKFLEFRHDVKPEFRGLMSFSDFSKDEILEAERFFTELSGLEFK